MQLLNAVRAELTKLTWRSGLFWAAIPLSIIVPVLITAGIAAGNEAIQHINSTSAPNEVQLPGGYSMSQDNAVYWVLFFSTFFMMCTAVNSYGVEVKNKTIDLFGYIQPRRWTLLAAKLIVYGVLGAITTVIAVLIIDGLFPKIFTQTWSQVELFSSHGIRFLWTIPLYTVLLVALGLGLVAFVRHTYIVVALVLFLKLGTEAFLAFADVNLADNVRHYSPFVNAEYSTGQLMGMPEGIWGQNLAILYYAVIFLLIFALGSWSTSRIPKR